jgi:hypothetical protein
MFIDFTLAPNAETAKAQVAERHEISDTQHDRLVAVREHWDCIPRSWTTAG